MPLDLEETKTRLRRTPDVLDVLLHELPDPWVREDEGPDTWSSFDVIGHLIEAEGTNWIPRVRHLIAHGEPAVFSPFDRFGFVEKSKGKSMAEMLAVVLAGLYFTAQTLRIGQETLRVNQEGQITERFTKAIEQLGSSKLEVRIGGIYALERIARDSARDHGPIMSVLTAFVRERPHWIPSRRRDSAKPPRPAIDIQGILMVLSRRDWRWDDELLT